MPSTPTVEAAIHGALDSIANQLADIAAYAKEPTYSQLRGLITRIHAGKASFVADKAASTGTEFVLLSSAVAFVILAWAPKLAHAIGEAVNHFHAAGL